LAVEIMQVIDKCNLKLDTPSLKENNNALVVCLKWSENVSKIWHGHFVLEVEVKTLHMKELKHDNESDQKNGSSEEKGEEKEEDKDLLPYNTWTKVCEVDPTTNTDAHSIELNQHWAIGWHEVRMRVAFYDKIFFSTYSNIQ
ncbi:hypothetical protein RFI_34701, partial [Reticulomyxa filosa]